MTEINELQLNPIYFGFNPCEDETIQYQKTLRLLVLVSDVLSVAEQLSHL